MVYLDNYKMLAITNNTSEIQFLSLPSGKLEYTLDVGLSTCTSLVPMKDKNALGVTNESENIIKIVQLHPLGDQVKVSSTSLC